LDHRGSEEQGQQEARIRQLQDLLNNAKVGEAPKQSGVALPGSVVAAIILPVVARNGLPALFAVVAVIDCCITI
jgi:hypothetical protein